MDLNKTFYIYSFITEPIYEKITLKKKMTENIF